jgi:hypothetical protein
LLRLGHVVWSAAAGARAASSRNAVDCRRNREGRLWRVASRESLARARRLVPRASGSGGRLVVGESGSGNYVCAEGCVAVPEAPWDSASALAVCYSTARFAGCEAVTPGMRCVTGWKRKLRGSLFI